ncbi:ACP S-malonyltransferase [Paenibacillus spiritus]|uniref:[acyl-carrier-protein] S-malonyltransferase n=1 Tax=Paenibacillus spiritus TaxID=2496557 RepID=A0A5J5FXL3_9BACL|nr:ACP S-malonyltransferase [Paenibacillus spiritus]KAA8998815.1 ACP S-malonyltransferase [Paenibacillus spiritus]
MNIALLLAGQGTKFPAETVRTWLEEEDTLALIEQAEAVLGEPVREWFSDDLSKDTRLAQLATYVGSMCMYQLYRKKIGLYPRYVLGHSLGELTALTIAGAWSYEEGLRLVDLRGTAMKTAIGSQESTGMMAIFAPPETVQALVKEGSGIYMANFNSAKQTVIAGGREAIQAFAAANGLEGVVLGVSGAFHTPYMQTAADSVYAALEGWSCQTHLSMHVIGNREAGLYRTERVREEIAAQIVHPVLWKQSVDYALKQGVQRFIDLSPGGMFAGMLAGQAKVDAFHTEALREALAAELKDDLEVDRHYDLFSRALGVIVSTKNGSDDAEAYDHVVVSGYNQIKSQIGKPVTAEEVRRTLELLELILKTKKVPEEQIHYHCRKLAWKAG